jgi:hypothetical protein
MTAAVRRALVCANVSGPCRRTKALDHNRRLDFEIAEVNILALEKNSPIEQTGNSIRIGYMRKIRRY